MREEEERGERLTATSAVQPLSTVSDWWAQPGTKQERRSSARARGSSIGNGRGNGTTAGDENGRWAGRGALGAGNGTVGQRGLGSRVGRPA